MSDYRELEAGEVFDLSSQVVGLDRTTRRAVLMAPTQGPPRRLDGMSVFESRELDLACPVRARSLFTVRAAISSARLSDRPCPRSLESGGREILARHHAEAETAGSQLHQLTLADFTVSVEVDVDAADASAIGGRQDFDRTTLNRGECGGLQTARAADGFGSTGCMAGQEESR